MKVAWVAPHGRLCGIADYSDALFPAVQAALRAGGDDAVFVSLDEHPTSTSLVAAIARTAPDVVHLQHEYGLFGGKNPPWYWFPRLVRSVAETLPHARRVATAHTVLAPDAAFPLRGRGVEIPLRWAANTFLIGRLRRNWGRDTWGGLHGVVVHTRDCVGPVRAAAPDARVEVIPHFVGVREAPRESGLREPGSRAVANGRRTLVVFGFLAPEKGQHLAIEALALLGDGHDLLIAGGVRRSQDRVYAKACARRVRELGLDLAQGEGPKVRGVSRTARVEITGTLAAEQIDAVLARADLVLAPHIASAGSGSVARALSLGLPVLASDLAVQREAVEAVPDALALFRAGDSADLAAQARTLLADAARTDRLREGARAYAALRSTDAIAARHAAFLRSLR